MDDRSTDAGQPPRPGLTYLFWTSGSARGGYARLNPDGTTLGADRAADIPMEDELAAPEQARIRREGEEWFIYDLAGSGTTMLDQRPIYRAALVDKSRVTLGRSSAVFRILG